MKKYRREAQTLKCLCLIWSGVCLILWAILH